MKKTLIPHPNVPNAEFGDANLKRVTTLFNENFNSLDTAVQSAQTSLASVESSKASSDHTHDERYARLEHQHVTDDVTGLGDLLDNKANLYHEHSQYLTEIPRHQHAINEVDGLIEILNDKAPSNHQHAMSDVTGLDALAANAATFEYVDRQDVANLAASKAYTDAAIGSITPVMPSSLTPLKDKDEGAVGTATTYARGDHQHQLNVHEDDETFTAGKVVDAFGEEETGEGTSNRYARADHQHEIEIDNSAGADSKVLMVGPNSKTVSALDCVGTDNVATITTGEGFPKTVSQTLTTFIDVGNLTNGSLVGVSQDSSNNPKLANVSVGNGLEKTNEGGLSVKCKANGGIANGEDGIALGGMTASKWVKTDETGALTTTNDTPITASTSTTGFVYNTQGTISYKSFGTAAGTVAEGNHTHSEQGTVKKVDNVPPGTDGNVELNALTTSNYGTTLNPVYQAKSDILGAVVSGGHYDDEQGAHEITGGAHYLAAAPSKPVLLGVAQGSTAVSAREAIGLDMVTYDGMNMLDDVIDQNGDVDSSHVVFSDATGNKVVETASDGSLIESASDYAKFTTEPTGGSFVKTVGADGTLEEDSFAGLTEEGTPGVDCENGDIGVSDYAARADHQHELNVAVIPSGESAEDYTKTCGPSASVGTANTYARSDHVHKWMKMDDATTSAMINPNTGYPNPPTGTLAFVTDHWNRGLHYPNGSNTPDNATDGSGNYIPNAVRIPIICRAMNRRDADGYMYFYFRYLTFDSNGLLKEVSQEQFCYQVGCAPY